MKIETLDGKRIGNQIFNRENVAGFKIWYDRILHLPWLLIFESSMIKTSARRVSVVSYIRPWIKAAIEITGENKRLHGPFCSLFLFNVHRLERLSDRAWWRPETFHLEHKRNAKKNYNREKPFTTHLRHVASLGQRGGGGGIRLILSIGLR